MKPSTERLALLVILAVALLLRVVGLAWGLPGELHRFSYHPDEWQAVETALRMIATGDANPHFFNYPTAHLELVAGLLRLALAAGASTPAELYLAARLLGVALGVGTVALVWAMGRRLASPRVGLAAAATLAVCPLAVVNSRFATMDGPLAWWCALVLWAAVRLVDEPAPPRWLLPLSGVAAGLAAGTKYNGAMVLLPLWCALALSRGRGAWGPAAVVTVLAALTFAASSRFVFLDPLAPRQIRFELFEHPRSTNLFADVGPGWLFHLRYNAPTALGYTAALAAIGGVGQWCRTRRRAAVPLLVWLALGLLSLLGTRELFIRYWLPLLPVLALAVGEVVAAADRRRWAALGLAAVVLLEPAARSGGYAAMLARPDARDLAAAWCFAQIPAGETVGVDGGPWFWSVPLQPNNGGARTGAERETGRYRLVTDPTRWAAEGARWLVVNQAHEAVGVPTGYVEAARFTNLAVIGPGWVEGGTGSRLHDWNYTRPDIVVYRRQ